MNNAQTLTDKVTETTKRKLNVLNMKLDMKEITTEEYLEQSNLVLEEQQKRYDEILKIDRSKKVEEQKEQKEKPSIKYSIVVWFASYLILGIIVVPIFAINFEHLIGIAWAIVLFISAIISAIYSRSAGYSVVLFCLLLPGMVGISNPSFSDGEQETKSEQVVEKKEETTYSAEKTKEPIEKQENKDVEVKIISTTIDPYKGLELYLNIKNNTDKEIIFTSFNLFCYEGNRNRPIYLYSLDVPDKNVTAVIPLSDSLAPNSSNFQYYTNYDGFWKVKNSNYIGKKFLPVSTSSLHCEIE